MPDYRETSLTGTAWQRCHAIVIFNPRSGSPSVRLEEERVIALADGSELRSPAGAVVVPFDPARQIPLRDPATGELTGESTTFGAAYAILYSAYLAEALARDEAAAAATS